MNEPIKQDREILKATLSPEGAIKITITSNHTPSLSYIHKLLGVEIDKRIINEQLRSAQKERPIIQKVPGNIVNFVRGKGSPYGS